MAVLVEAISVIVRRDSIIKKFTGGWSEFLKIIPNQTLCFDDDLARVGFMSPHDVEAFVRQIEQRGLTFLLNGKARDLAVIDQRIGVTVPTEWLEFAHLSVGAEGNKVAACWLFEDERIGSGLHVPANGMHLATPNGWIYEKSLSKDFMFVKNEELDDKLKFLRHEDGMDVYLDLSTGEEIYSGRLKK